MIYIDGDSCMAGSGIHQEMYGFKRYYTGKELIPRLKNGKTLEFNKKMHKRRDKDPSLAYKIAKAEQLDNVSSQLIKKQINLTSRASGGSSNQAICSRIIDAVINNNAKTVFFSPTTLSRMVYPRPGSQSLTFGQLNDYNPAYTKFLQSWIEIIGVNQTQYLEVNALYGLINFCKDNNIELVGISTPLWKHQLERQYPQEIRRTLDKINEICILNMGSSLDDNTERLYTECGHPNLECHTRLAEDICTHLKK